MQKMSVAEARRPDAVGKVIEIQGWTRTRRDSKGGFSFIELNDGSCLGNVQVLADGSLANYESEIKKLPVGASIIVAGEVRPSPAQGLPTEVKASRITVLGQADPKTYALQK